MHTHQRAAVRRHAFETRSIRPVVRLTTLAPALVALLLGCQDPSTPTAPDLPAGASAAANVGAKLTASAITWSETAIDVSWQDSSPNQSGFEIHRSSTGVNGGYSLLTAVGLHHRAYRDQSLSPGTEYCYKVRAIVVNGSRTKYSAFSNSVCAVTFMLPPVPVQSAFAQETSTGFLISWIDASTNEDGFRIYSSTDWWTPQLVGSVGPNVTSWVTDQPVCYSVAAFNAAGEGRASSPTCTTPLAPTNLTVTDLGNGRFELTWTDNSAIETAYEVWLGYSSYCCPDSGGCDAGAYELSLGELPANTTSFQTGTWFDECVTSWMYVAAKRYDGWYSSPSNSVVLPSSGGPR